MIVDYAHIRTSEEKRKRERVFVLIVAERKIPQSPTFFANLLGFRV